MENSPSVAPTSTFGDHEPISGPSPAGASSSTPTTYDTQQPTPVPATPTAPQDWEIKKELCRSDIGVCTNAARMESRKDSILFRLKHERTHIRKHLDDTSSKKLESVKECEINVYDVDKEVEFQLTLRQYGKKGHCYIFTDGWIENFIDRRNLYEGDKVGFQWDVNNNGNQRLLFGVISQVKPPEQHYTAADGSSYNAAVPTSSSISSQNVVQTHRNVPRTLNLFHQASAVESKWVIEKELTERDCSEIDQIVFDCSPQIDQIINNLDAKSRQEINSYNQCEINVHDWDEKDEYKLTLRRIDSSYSLTGGWLQNFVNKRQLSPGDRVGFGS